MLRPFFPFYGSKWRIANKYPRPTGHVVEPFAGSAGYSTFYGCHLVTLIDKDPIIVGVWQYLMTVSPQEVMRLPNMDIVGDSVDNYNLPQEAKWLIGFWINRGSSSPGRARTRYSSMQNKSQLVWGERAKQRIASQIPRLDGWTIAEGDFEDSCIKDLPQDTTWFIDPPYQDKGKFYRVRFDQYDRLSRWATTRQGKVIVCEGGSASWMPFSPLGQFKTTKGKALELVWLSQ